MTLTGLAQPDEVLTSHKSRQVLDSQGRWDNSKPQILRARLKHVLVFRHIYAVASEAYLLYHRLVLSGDLLHEARRRAALSQAELGRRVGKPASVIGRWERGGVLPSLETLRELVHACGLELSFRLANYDDSYEPHIRRMLAKTPAERVEHATARARSYGRLRRQFEQARRG